MLEPLEPHRHLNGAIYVTINKAADTPLVVNGRTYRRSEQFRVDARTPLWNKPLRIDLGAGDDVLDTNGFPGVYSATYKIGAGNDRLNVEQSSVLLNVDAGDGTDVIGVRMSVDCSASNVAIYAGMGRDRVAIDASVYYDSDGITGKLLIDDAGGATDVSLNGVRVKREAVILTRGSSSDRVTLTGCRFLRPLVIQTSGGVDTITADAATTFKRGAAVIPGDEDDSVVGF